MPTFNIPVTVSTRVADLVGDAAERAQTIGSLVVVDPLLSPRDWFAERVRRVAVEIARSEQLQQESEAGQADLGAIDSEVTVE